MAEGRSDGDVPGMLGSEPDFDVVCQPCGYDGNTVVAEGYCLDCSEHLCATCYTYHKKVPISRHHKLVDKENMSDKPTSVKVKDVCTERCQSHEDKVIEYYCPLHKMLGCTVCITIKHKLCEDVGYIPEITRDFETSEDYKSFQTKLKSLMMQWEMSIQSTTDCKENLIRYYTKVQEDIEAYKQEILDRFNQLQQDIKNRIDDLKRTEIDRMNTVLNTGNGVIEELKKMSSDFETLRSNKQYCQLFTDMNNSEKKISELSDKLKKVNDICARVVKFEAGQQLRTLMRNQDACGKVVSRLPKDTTLCRVTDVNVRTHTSSDKCIISGVVVLSDNRLVVADCQNYTIRLIDTINRKVISEIEPGSFPWDVARVSQNQVIVTQPNLQKLLLLRCDDKLVSDREIKVNGHCRGIDCAQNKLFVAYEYPAKLEILSLSGELLQKFDTNSQGQRLFSDPRYVCVNPRSQSIYVSDYINNSVLQLDMDGKVMAEYKDDELKMPGRMTVDSWGNVYLCGENSHNVHMLTPECRKVKIFLEKDDGLSDPRSVCRCDATDTLYFGMFKNDTVKVYHIE